MIERQQLTQLAASIKSADEILGRAERSGMEVSQPRLELTQAHDALMKSRVTIHSFKPALLDADIKPGMATAAKDYAAGKKAMEERNFRRIGLGLSLVAILLVLIGLQMYIRHIEQNDRQEEAVSGHS